jgi:hypothetical protein
MLWTSLCVPSCILSHSFQATYPAFLGVVAHQGLPCQEGVRSRGVAVHPSLDARPSCQVVEAPCLGDQTCQEEVDHQGSLCRIDTPPSRQHSSMSVQQQQQFYAGQVSHPWKAGCHKARATSTRWWYQRHCPTYTTPNLHTNRFQPGWLASHDPHMNLKCTLRPETCRLFGMCLSTYISDAGGFRGPFYLVAAGDWFGSQH